MKQSEPPTRLVGRALRHRNDERFLRLSPLAAWPLVTARCYGDPRVAGREVRRLLAEVIDELCVCGDLHREPVLLYISLRYRDHLPVAEVASTLAYSREHITRKYRKPAILRVTYALIAKNSAFLANSRLAVSLPLCRSSEC